MLRVIEYFNKSLKVTQSLPSNTMKTPGKTAERNVKNPRTGTCTSMKEVQVLVLGFAEFSSYY